jgi:hypothetical protein
MNQSGITSHGSSCFLSSQLVQDVSSEGFNLFFPSCMSLVMKRRTVIFIYATILNENNFLKPNAGRPH